MSEATPERPTEDVYTAPQAARVLGISDRRVRQMLEAARVEPERVFAENYLTGRLLPFLEAEAEAARVELRRYKREIGLLED